MKEFYKRRNIMTYSILLLKDALKNTENVVNGNYNLAPKILTIAHERIISLRKSISILEKAERK